MSRSEQSTLKEVLTQQIRDKMMPDSTVQKQFDQVFIFNIKTVKNTLITKRVLRAFLLWDIEHRISLTDLCKKYYDAADISIGSNGKRDWQIIIFLKLVNNWMQQKLIQRGWMTKLFIIYNSIHFTMWSRENIILGECRSSFVTWRNGCSSSIATHDI